MEVDPRIICRDFLRNCQGRVRRPIVNDNHFHVSIALIQYRPESSSNESFTIANWNYDTNQVVDITTLCAAPTQSLPIESLQFRHFSHSKSCPHLENQTTRWRSPEAIGLGHFERSEEHTSELQSHVNLVCRLLLEKKKKN